MKVGVIVGRFQTPDLTDGHILLLETAAKENEQVLVFIGTSPVRNTKCEPIPFQLRADMIFRFLFKLPSTMRSNSIPPVIKSIKDVGNLPVWCAELDELIRLNTGPNAEVTIYGGRNSIANYYKGKHIVKEIDSLPNVSASQTRDDVFKTPSKYQYSPKSFMAGMVYASQWRYPTGHPTADAALIRDGYLLLCQKPNRPKLNLIGGFFDPTLDDCLEETAIRELKEETGVVGKNPTYIGSFKVEHDYRYVKETDKIITTLFKLDYVSGEAFADDDIVGTAWIHLLDLQRSVEKHIDIDHVKAVHKLLEHLDLK